MIGQRLLDQNALEKLHVRDVIERYFFAVDARDRDALQSCFSHNAVLDYNFGAPDQGSISGGKAIAEMIFSACVRFTASNHSVSNIQISLATGTAEANIFATAHVVVGDKALVRGLRYEDGLVRNETGWLVAARRHTPLWQIELKTTTPNFF